MRAHDQAVGPDNPVAASRKVIPGITSDDYLQLGRETAERLRRERDVEQEIIKRESAIQSALARKAWERLKGRQVDTTASQTIPGTKPPFTAVDIKTSGAGNRGQPDVKELASEVARQVAELMADRGVDVVLSQGRPADRPKKGQERNKPASGRSKPTKLSLANQTLLALAEERRRAFIKDGYPETAADQLLAEQFCSLSAEKLLPLINRRMKPVDARTIRRTEVYKRWKPFRHPNTSPPITAHESDHDSARLDASAEGLSLSGSLKRFLNNGRDPLDAVADRWAREQGAALPAAF
jgi:hypothetical protein